MRLLIYDGPKDQPPQKTPEVKHATLDKLWNYPRLQNPASPPGAIKAAGTGLEPSTIDSRDQPLPSTCDDANEFLKLLRRKQPPLPNSRWWRIQDRDAVTPAVSRVPEHCRTGQSQSRLESGATPLQGQWAPRTHQASTPGPMTIDLPHWYPIMTRDFGETSSPPSNTGRH